MSAGSVTFLVAALIVGLLLKIGVSLLARDAQGWLPYLSEWIIRRAARRLPPEQVPRWEEEALRHIVEFRDRPVSGLLHAVDTWRSSLALRGELVAASHPPDQESERRIPTPSSLAATAVDQVRAIVEAAERSATDVQTQADGEAARIVDEATLRANEILAEADSDARERLKAADVLVRLRLEGEWDIASAEESDTLRAVLPEAAAGQIRTIVEAAERAAARIVAKAEQDAAVRLNEAEETVRERLAAADDLGIRRLREAEAIAQDFGREAPSRKTAT